MGSSAELLEVRDLSVQYASDRGPVRAATEVGFRLDGDTVLGLVGESGCGKTTVAKALLCLLPPTATVSGRVLFRGKDLLAMGQREMRRVRWRHISWIPQSAMNSLNPVYRVGDQLTEALREHSRADRRQAAERLSELYRMVGMKPDRARLYPHQMSGGMRQRAAIAMAMALDPEIIIADEPTTSLDVVVQAQVLRSINRVQAGRSGAMILVTHDMGVVAQTCSVVAVMYAGRIVESGGCADVLRQPYHPYTMGLKHAFPSLVGPRRELVSIPGFPPDLTALGPGCAFAPRCPFALPRCLDRPPPVEQVAGREVRCHRLEERDRLWRTASRPETWAEGRPGAAQPGRRQPGSEPVAEAGGGRAGAQGGGV